MTTKKIALEYLKKERLLNIDMIESINRDTCNILYADSEAVLLLEKSSNAYMLSTYNTALAENLIATLNKKDLFVIHQHELLNLIKNKFIYNNYFECKQVAYLKNTPINNDNNITIEKLSSHHKKLVGNT